MEKLVKFFENNGGKENAIICVREALTDLTILAVRGASMEGKNRCEDIAADIELLNELRKAIED